MIVGRFFRSRCTGGSWKHHFIKFSCSRLDYRNDEWFGILISQAYGAKDEKRLRHYVAMSTYLCVILAIIMTGLLLANGWILTTMNTPEKFMQIHEIYCDLFMRASGNDSLQYACCDCKIFGRQQDTAVFLVLSSILNIGLDFLLVAVIPLGVSGAAYATVASQAVSGVLCLVYVWKKYEIVHFGKEERAISLRSVKTFGDGSSDGAAVFLLQRLER